MYLEHLIKKIIKEETDLPPFIRRRLKTTDEQMWNEVKAFAMRGFKPGNIEDTVSRAMRNAAYEILDPIRSSLGDKEYYELEKRVIKFLEDKYSDKLIEFISDFITPEDDQYDGYRYVFEKHSNYSGGGAGFTQGFAMWGDLLTAYAYWFPDLNWKKIKSDLDKNPTNKRIRLKNVGDNYNIYNYYFSVIKLPGNL